MSEVEVVRPLPGEECKDIIAQKIAEAVRESLDSTCWLYGMSWPRFRANWRVEITLDGSRDPEMPEERQTDIEGVLHTQDWKSGEPVLVGSLIEDGKTIEVDGEIPYTPPNELRREMGLPVPTVVERADGSTEQKAVLFQRKARRAHAQ